MKYSENHSKLYKLLSQTAKADLKKAFYKATNLAVSDKTIQRYFNTSVYAPANYSTIMIDLLDKAVQFDLINLLNKISVCSKQVNESYRTIEFFKTYLKQTI